MYPSIKEHRAWKKSSVDLKSTKNKEKWKQEACRCFRRQTRDGRMERQRGGNVSCGSLDTHGGFLCKEGFIHLSQDGVLLTLILAGSWEGERGKKTKKATVAVVSYNQGESIVWHYEQWQDTVTLAVHWELHRKCCHGGKTSSHLTENPCYQPAFQQEATEEAPNAQVHYPVSGILELH